MKRIMWLAIGMLAFACYATASQAVPFAFDCKLIATISTSTGITQERGTITCNPGDVVNIDGSITQIGGSFLVACLNTLDRFPCDGMSRQWMLVIAPSDPSAKFHTGLAQITCQATVGILMTNIIMKPKATVEAVP